MYSLAECSGNRKGVRTVHLGGDDSAGQDTATDRDHTGEGALLVDVGALNGGLGRAEAQTNILIPSPSAGVLAGTGGLVVQEDVRLHVRVSISRFCWTCDAVRRVLSYLLLESALGLDTVFQSACGVDCGSAATYVSSVAMVAIGMCCRSGVAQS